jgi:hypothetical protein
LGGGAAATARGYSCILRDNKKAVIELGVLRQLREANMQRENLSMKSKPG